MKTMSIALRKMSIALSFIFSITSLLMLIALLLGVSSCTDDVKITHKYTYLEPVYVTSAEVREAFEVTQPQVIHTTGKIYFLNGYLFINEPGKGVHVIDNKDPRHPQNIAFINIPGNFDMAAKGNVLYVDSYIDLLALDVSDVQNVEILKRVENVFPIRYDVYNTQQEPVLLTEWREVEVVEVLEDDLGDQVYPGFYQYDRGFLVNANTAESFDAGGWNNGTAAPSAAGFGGSMARFTVMGNHLYTIDSYNMRVFDITTLQNPVAGNVIDVGWNIETIFPYEESLFIGAQNGMYIFDASNPNNPVQSGTFEHVQSCDPVIVDNDIAYVTLRSGNECQGFTNQLDVVNVSNKNSPQLMVSHQMENPHGLGKDGDLLFICEGDYGLKVFNAADPLKIGENLIVHYQDVHAYDVIPLNGVLMLIGEEGVYQYDYTNPENIKQLSMISIIRE